MSGVIAPARKVGTSAPRLAKRFSLVEKREKRVRKNAARFSASALEANAPATRYVMVHADAGFTTMGLLHGWVTSNVAGPSGQLEGGPDAQALSP